MNILIVDDEEGSRCSLSIVLKMAGHEIIPASCAEDALVAMSKSTVPFDLIITDDLMPGSSGCELVKMVNAQGYNGNIIVFSAYLNPGKKEEYRRLGVCGVMSKPYDITDFRQWLACLPMCFSSKHNGGLIPLECKPGDSVECWGKPTG